MFVCFEWISEQSVIIFLYNIKWFISILEAIVYLLHVQAEEYLSAIQVNFYL